MKVDDKLLTALGDLKFWLWACTENARSFTRFRNEYKLGQGQQELKDRLWYSFHARLRSDQFVSAALRLARSFERAAKIIPELGIMKEIAPHLVSEIKNIRDMREHYLEYEEGEGQKPKLYMRQSEHLSGAFMGSSPGESSPGGFSEDEVGTMFGGRLSFEQALSEIAAIGDIVSIAEIGTYFAGLPGHREISE